MNLLVLLFTLLTLVRPADDDHRAERGTFALVNARIETVTDGVIEPGTLVIQDDRIVALGSDVEIPSEAVIIDCEGQTVYPGLIDAGTRVGLTEISSIAQTRDYNEVGDINPHVEALTAVNPNSVLIPVTRVSGVTTVLTQPAGGLFPGKAAMINLHGFTPDQMSLDDRQYMMLTFPSSVKSSPYDRRSDKDIEKAYEKGMKQLNSVWDDLRLYARIDSAHQAAPADNAAPEYSPHLRALLPVLRGEMPLTITVNAGRDILNAIEWVQERNIGRPIFSGVAEGWRVADKIADAGIPCLVGPVLSTPTRASDRYDKPYANAGLLHKAGVRVAIRSGEAENVRNLPFNAGFAAAYGLGREQALRAVTITPAEIFGVSDLVGSLEVGKKANVFVADGDPFETQTSIHHVFIDGYKIPLDNRHRDLYEEFLQREPGLQKHPQTPEVTVPTG